MVSNSLDVSPTGLRVIELAEVFYPRDAEGLEHDAIDRIVFSLSVYDVLERKSSCPEEVNSLEIDQVEDFAIGYALKKVWTDREKRIRNKSELARLSVPSGSTNYVEKFPNG